jgi:hypothetical protein
VVQHSVSLGSGGVAPPPMPDIPPEHGPEPYIIGANTVLTPARPPYAYCAWHHTRYEVDIRDIVRRWVCVSSVMYVTYHGGYYVWWVGMGVHTTSISSCVLHMWVWWWLEGVCYPRPIHGH